VDTSKYSNQITSATAPVLQAESIVLSPSCMYVIRCLNTCGLQLVLCPQVFLQREQLSLDVIKQCRVKCPTVPDKQKVLKEMIFPNCEKLGQTIIFVRTRDTARSLHNMVWLQTPVT